MVHSSSGDDELLVALIVAQLALVVVMFRMLALHPAPALVWGSLRRSAGRLLVAQLPRRRRFVPSDRAGHRARQTRVLLYLAAPLGLLLPIDVAAGPLDDPMRGEDYLQTMWQGGRGGARCLGRNGGICLRGL